MRVRIELFGLVRIATYNVNGIKARLPRLLEWLNETKPDIVCLQELKSSDETFPGDAIRNAGYGAIWHGQKAWNGVAILARGGAPVEIRKGLDGDADDDHSRYIEGDALGVRIGCLYLPNGNPIDGPKFAYKLRWMDRFNAHAAELLALELPVVLAGDYNVVPTDTDISDPRILEGNALIQPESRAAFRRLVAQGWADAVLMRHPHDPPYTFWDYTMNAFARDAGFRIDHLMLSPEAADKLTEAGVDRDYRGREKASDHAPTWVVLR